MSVYSCRIDRIVFLRRQSNVHRKAMEGKGFITVQT